MLRNQICEIFPIGPERIDARRFDPVTAVMGGASILGNVIGGGMQASASKKAAEQQGRAATEAKDLVGVAIGDANRPIADATAGGQNMVTTGIGRVIDTGGAAKAGMDAAVSGANERLNPYAETGADALGTLRTMLAPGGQLTQQFTADNFRQLDPGFDFRLQQAQKALERSAAAKGGAMGGGAARDLAAYSQGLASQEFGNAFTRFQTQNNDLFSRLNAVSGMGLNASARQGENSITGARYGGDVSMDAAKSALSGNEFGAELGLRGATSIGDNTLRGAMAQGDYLTQRGNAQAAGTVGSANAWANGITGGINGGANLLLLRQLLQNPEKK